MTEPATTEEDPAEGSAGSADPVEFEPDVPKPAFELPAEGEGGEPDKEPRKGSKWAERRAQKGAGYAAELAASRAEAAEARAERQRLAEQVAELRGRFEEKSRAQPGADPYDAKLADVAERMERALARMGGGDNTATSEWHSLRREEAALIYRRDRETADREAAAKAPKVDPVLASVTARYDWLTTDADARTVAEGIVAKLVRSEKRDMTNAQIRRATLMQAAAETEKELGIGGGGTEPTDAQRERFRGVSGAGTGAGRSGKTVVAMTGDQKAQAEALFRHLDAEAAHRKWWDSIGQKIANK